ncbi:hypothetical protein MSD52_001170 [Salmonella enterica]|nr:hypothetical protein [Salmonella enterica subsp. enterica]EGC1894131.1 hypothetical protein [Salmonella enterica]EHQ1633059.1 hypothetical protein [Salmonella enterica]EIH1281790.1 hypothetical protein [Salmonella enterica]EJB7135690.1 hypothetical protein [Salmonella enterica]
MKFASPAQAMFAKAMNAHYNKKDAQKRGVPILSTVDFAERQRRIAEDIDRRLAKAGF